VCVCDDLNLIIWSCICAVEPIAEYYIIAGIVYQAPDLVSVINARLVRWWITVIFELLNSSSVGSHLAVNFTRLLHTDKLPADSFQHRTHVAGLMARNRCVSYDIPNPSLLTPSWHFTAGGKGKVAKEGKGKQKGMSVFEV